MRRYDCDQGAQEDIIDAGDIEPATNTKKTFEGFKSNGDKTFTNEPSC